MRRKYPEKEKLAKRLAPALGHLLCGTCSVWAQNPETRPRRIKKSPAPPFHVLRKKVRKALWEAYGAFFAAFREAEFPVGSFPLGLPFVAG